MAVDILFMLLSSASGSASAETFWVWIYLAGIFTLAADAWTLAWLGLWNGLAARHANRAAGHTVSQVLVLPWFLFLSALFAISLLNLDRAGRDMEYLILALWVGISFLLNAVWFFWARSQLNDRLREIVASRFNAPTPWLVRLGLRRPAATTPPTLP
jgi:hypothetical protein